MSEKLVQIVADMAKYDQRNINDYRKKAMEYYNELKKIEQNFTEEQQVKSLEIQTIIANDRVNSISLADLNDRRERFGLFASELVEVKKKEKESTKSGNQGNKQN